MFSHSHVELHTLDIESWLNDYFRNLGSNYNDFTLICETATYKP